jgi:hypothetical protein
MAKFVGKYNVDASDQHRSVYKENAQTCDISHTVLFPFLPYFSVPTPISVLLDG